MVAGIDGFKKIEPFCRAEVTTGWLGWNLLFPKVVCLWIAAAGAATSGAGWATGFVPCVYGFNLFVTVGFYSCPLSCVCCFRDSVYFDCRVFLFIFVLVLLAVLILFFLDVALLWFEYYLILWGRTLVPQ